jgi:hypothetical protein
MVMRIIHVGCVARTHIAQHASNVARAMSSEPRAPSQCDSWVGEHACMLAATIFKSHI